MQGAQNKQLMRAKNFHSRPFDETQGRLLVGSGEILQQELKTSRAAHGNREQIASRFGLREALANSESFERKAFLQLVLSCGPSDFPFPAGFSIGLIRACGTLGRRF